MLLTGCLARRLTYLPPGMRTPSPPPDPFEEVLLDIQGDRIAAWWRPPAEEGGPLILFFYGNGMCLEACRGAGLFDRIAADGAGLLSLDYPGYGNSDGAPSEAGIASASDAAVAWLSERRRGAPVVAMGQSLGAAVAVGAACRNPERIAALVLLAPFTSLADAARAHYPGWLVGLALRERYDSADILGCFGKPVLVIHGGADEVIPVGQGRALAAAGSGRFVEVPGARHNDLTDYPQVWDEIRGFLRPIARAE